LGRTKQEVRDKLKALHGELNAGVKSSSTYTVREAVDDWLREGLGGTSERTRTLYEGLLEPVLEGTGARPLRDLGARDVRSALSLLATRYSTRSLQITQNSLERAIRHAESNDLVGRNVAALVKTPHGRPRSASPHAQLATTCGVAGAGCSSCAAHLGPPPIAERGRRSGDSRAQFRPIWTVVQHRWHRSATVQYWALYAVPWLEDCRAVDIRRGAGAGNPPGLGVQTPAH
jgi:hypothetical protein